MHHTGMYQLSCKSCGSALEISGFDRRLAVVHCSHCGVLFDLTKSRTPLNTVDEPASLDNANTKTNSDSKPGSEAGQRPVAAMPAGFKVFSANGKLSVHWSWRNSAAVLFLFSTIVFNAILIFQFSAFSNFRFGGFGSGFDLFRSFVALAGIGMLYRGVAGILNTTTITVDQNRLVVRHAPLPWVPAPKLDASSVEQLFVSEGYTKSKNGTRTPYYLLNAVLRDNSLKRLSTKLPEIEQALYLEQEFERALHIRDRRVAGEVRGTTRDI